MCLKRALEKEGGINHQDAGSAPGISALTARGGAAQGSGPASGGPSTATPTRPLPYTVPTCPLPYTAGEGGRTLGAEEKKPTGPEFQETGLWLPSPRPGSRLRPAARAPRARRPPGRPPDSPRPSRSRPVGPGRGSRKAPRLPGLSAPRHEVCGWRPGEVPGRVLCSPPAGRPGTDASGGGRACPSEARRPSARRAPSACRAGSLTPCSERSRGAAAAPRLRRLDSLDLFPGASGRRPSLPPGILPPPCPPLPHLTKISQQLFRATLSSATSSAWGWGLRRE